MDKQKDQQAYCRNLATAFMAVSFVDKHADQLVRYLGKGTERTNYDAMVYWIGRQYKVLKDLEKNGIDPVDYLYAELLRVLPTEITGY